MHTNCEITNAAGTWTCSWRPFSGRWWSAPGLSSVRAARRLWPRMCLN